MKSEQSSANRKRILVRCDGALLSGFDHVVPCLAIISFSVTTCELAVVGGPAINLCLRDDHAQSASSLADTGLGISLGEYRPLNSVRVSEAISNLLA